MRIGAYQFPVSGNMADNFIMIKKAIKDASAQGVELLVFPECALTGYPPRDISDSSVVDFDKVDEMLSELKDISREKNISVIVGTIYRENDMIHNSAVVLTNKGEKYIYHKRALWGWDKDNFTAGNKNGKLELDGWKIGVRICFEVRFPEFFQRALQGKC